VRVLYVNPRSGAGRHASEVRTAAAARGIRVLELGDGLPAEATVVGVAGGDGSLAGVARFAVERELPFVVVPCGTRNHLARDLGLRLDDPVGALEAFDGVERRIDVGEVEGRLFVNNLSLGAYALYRHRRLGELLDRHRREVVVDRTRLNAAILLVGNNVYDRFGRRARLDGGVLSVYATAGLIPRIAVERTATEVDIEFPVLDRVEAAIDGEAVTLPAGLHPCVRAQALRVLT
jgi:hypothetical protein